MLHLDAKHVYDNLSQSNYAKSGFEQLEAMVRDEQPQAVELEHFEAWFRADRQEMPVLHEDEPQIASSILLELYRPEFEAHAKRDHCTMEWSKYDSFIGPQEFVMRFRCTGRY